MVLKRPFQVYSLTVLLCSIVEGLARGTQNNGPERAPVVRPQKVFGPSKPTPKTFSEGTWNPRGLERLILL